MKAKNGKAGSAVNPKAPEEAKEAATEKPAETQKAAARQDAATGTPPGPTQLGSGASSSGASSSATQDQPAETHWIGIELKDEEGNPVADESFRVKLADGSIKSGRLDAEGKARIEDVPAGKHEINFPRLHGDDWKAG